MLTCFTCPQSYEEDKPRYKCDCGSFLVHEFDQVPKLEPKSLANRQDSWWRYREALPLKNDDNIVSLGERATRLVPGQIQGEQVHFKVDGDCPTGSFKDRGSFLMISKFKEWGLKEIVEDSSGNAGASVAAYSQAAGIQAKVFAPAYTSPGKLKNIAQYGPLLITVAGSREDTAAAALIEAESSFYASHNWNPYFAAGVKTLAFELWEQLDYTAPDAVIVPVGGGSSLLGLYYGFKELLQSERIGKIPRLIAVQSESCDPLFRAYTAQEDSVYEVQKKPTVAEGIVIANPVKGRAMLKALRETDGSCLTVDDSQILTYLAVLESQQLLVEPTSAVGVAGYAKALSTGIVTPQDKVIIELTGKKK